MHEMPDLVRDRARLDEEFVGPIVVTLPGPLKIDHRVDNDIGYVNALWTQLASNRFSQDPLRRFGGCETCETALAPQCRCIAGGNNGALALADHRGGKSPG